MKTYIWWFVNIVVSILLIISEYFAYNYMIRDIIKILPELTFLSFWFLTTISFTLMSNYKFNGLMMTVLKIVGNKFPDITVEYEVKESNEALVGLIKLGSIWTTLLMYYYIIIDLSWLDTNMVLCDLIRYLLSFNG